MSPFVWWAVVKFAATIVVAPIAAPIVAWRAAANHARAQAQVRALPDQLAAVAEGGSPAGAANRVGRLPASTDAVIVSDLHRSYHGRREWSRVQHTDELYEAMLDHYGAAGWHVVENGDTDDFWMVGGSTYGARYDTVRLALSVVPGEWGRRARRSLHRSHLMRIEADNQAIFDRLASLGTAGRYHRTVGNHDDVMLDPWLATIVEERLGVRPVDWIVLAGDDGAEAVITHGHQTDAWNAPGRALLGRLATWIANTLADVPGLDSPESLPGPDQSVDLLEGRRQNRLTGIGSRFGANANFDSLDEELLFDAIGEAGTAGPWLILGHTHVPLLSPLSRSGARWARYANAGHGLWHEMITAIEWPGSAAAGPEGRVPRLVAWVHADQLSCADIALEIVTTGTTTGRGISRVELAPTADGRRLEPVSAAGVAEAADAALGVVQ
ncbi:MAG TPA: hypothetical protein VJM33_13800 [Microthrixaceae bacterium]|nr:hypothetical protein [Microthrixaceae bacterium]